MRSNLKFFLMLTFAASAWAAPPPCSPQVFPVKFENQYVRICENKLAPGAAEPVHTHSDDVVFVMLEGSKLPREDAMGNPPPQRVGSSGDDVSAIEVLKPYTHRGVNDNTGGNVRLLIIELKMPRTGKPGTQKPTGGAVLENSRVRVFRYVLGPGESAPMHTHKRPYVIISAKPMTLSMTDPQGKNLTHDVAEGDSHFQSPPVTHDLKNAGKAAGEIVEIELK